MNSRCSPLGHIFTIARARNADILKLVDGVTEIIPRSEMLKHVMEIGVIGRRLNVRKYERTGGKCLD